MRLLLVSLVGALAFAPLAACLSSAPPAAPVRYFDPLPALHDAGAGARPIAAVRVVAGGHVRDEVAVRVGAHEVAYDGEHRWLRPPLELVEVALARAGVRSDPAARDAVVRLDGFELERGPAPCARIRMFVERHGLPDHVLQVAAPADGDSVEMLVRAMGDALAEAAAGVAACLQGP